MSYLIVFLSVISAWAAGPTKNPCDVSGAFADDLATQFSNAVQGRAFTTRDGKPISVKVVRRGLTTEMDLLDARGVALGNVELVFSADGRMVTVEAAYLGDQLKGSGMTTSLLRLVYDLAQPGTRIEFESRNLETNEALARLTGRIERSADYRLRRGDPAEERQRYHDERIGRIVRRQLRDDPDAAPLWARVLSSSGWENVTVRQSRSNPDVYFLRARKSPE